eukprot:1193623-Prorocentrum_minimum.AAC.7
MLRPRLFEDGRQGGGPIGGLVRIAIRRGRGGAPLGGGGGGAAVGGGSLLALGPAAVALLPLLFCLRLLAAAATLGTLLLRLGPAARLGRAVRVGGGRRPSLALVCECLGHEDAVLCDSLLAVCSRVHSLWCKSKAELGAVATSPEPEPARACT